MKREIIKTEDGSTTIHIPAWDEQYHSIHGAISEAKHVFIKKGLQYVLAQKEKSTVHILEIGFGTGLNAFVTFLENELLHKKITYTGVEAYPIVNKEIKEMNYVEVLNAQQYDEVFKKMHTTSWGKSHKITDRFLLTKREQFFKDIEDQNIYDLIYFDAFGARVQPELWTEAIFEIMYKALKKEGVLVTYSAKGSVRRAMQAVGFEVERLPGPPGKREMLRGLKKQ